MAVLARQVLHLDIAQLERDADLQARVGLNADVVKEYAEQMDAGATFPPVLVFARPGAWSLVDGFHRVAARESLGLATVLAETRPGTREEAIWYGLTVNQKHGLRRSNDDKHRCVVKALTQPRGQMLSDRQLASHCGVHHYTVSRIRQQLERSQVIEVRDTCVVTRGGISYEQRLQKNRSSAKPAEAPALLQVSDIAPEESAALSAREVDTARDRPKLFPQGAAIVAAVASDPPAPLRFPQRLDCVPDRLEQSNFNQRVRQLIRQAHGSLDEALRELSRAECDTDRQLKRLCVHLTHLCGELSSAESRLAAAPLERLNGTQGY
jgi:hypothetical protein